MIRKISIILPAYNEEQGVVETITSIPRQLLIQKGYKVEIIVVDNNSSDNTAGVARKHGARVISEPKQGYGYAYKAGISSSNGEIIVAADADGTYPLETLPSLLALVDRHKLDFITTNRFGMTGQSPSVSRINIVGNKLLNAAVRLLFRIPLADSQSGMWIVRRSALEHARLTATGMAFSEEIKIELLYYQRIWWREIAIEYRQRVGESKLHPMRDGIGNLMFLVKKRIRR